MKRRVTSLLAITAMTVSCIFVGCGETQEAMGSAEDELVADGLTGVESLDSDVDIIVEDYMTDGMEIISSEGLTDAQKQEAVDAMVEMTAIAEKEAAAEILLEAKGFKDVVVSINGDTVYVTFNTTEPDEVTREQIAYIVARKTEIPVENIVIGKVEDKGNTAALYMPGTYTSELVLGEHSIDVEVIVDKDNLITSIQMVDLGDYITMMYPLLMPTFDSICEQIYEQQSLENITYTADNKYTTLALLDVIQNALNKAKKDY